MYITPRYLLAIIRISQAMAKFHFRDLVKQEDVDQAMKLMDFSFNTLQAMYQENQTQKRKDNKDDKFSKYINDIRGILKANGSSQMHALEILKNLKKVDGLNYGQINIDNLQEVLNYY